jgi:hypothetical protein
VVVAAALVPWRRGRGRVPALLAGAALVWGISWGTTGAAADTTVPEADRSAVMARLTDGLEDALPPGDCPVLVRFAGDVGWAWGAGVVLAVEKAGHDVRVDPRWRVMFGDRAVDDAPPDSPLLTVVAPNGDGPGAVVTSSRFVQVRLAGGTCGPG